MHLHESFYFYIMYYGDNMEIKEGYIDYKEYKTYYRIVNPNGHKTPLVMLHGGPGSTHNSFELFDELAYESDRPIIMYDQLGCGKSHIEKGHTDLWNKKTWAEELINLREKLNLKEIHLLGHSWGGMLLIIYMTDYMPEGVKSITLSSTLSSAKLWEEETHRLIDLIDPKVKEILLKSEEADDFSSKEASEALDYYYDKFVFSTSDNDPECLRRLKPDASESYITAWGKSEFKPTGTLKDYEYTEKLKNIKVPVLINSGVNDESTPYQNKVMFDALTTNKKKWVLYKHSRHRTYYEDRDEYMKCLKEFLDSCD